MSTKRPSFSVTAGGQAFQGTERSRGTAGRTLGKRSHPCESRHASSSRPAREPILPWRDHCSSSGAASSGTYSEGWKVRLGKAGAKTSICAPVPEATSSARPLRPEAGGRRIWSCSSIGRRLRSAAG
eukprot:scaffold50070_cov112-Isochrysis_galbana.AAC.3